MAERLHRAQILLASEQHQILTRIANEEGRSLSDLVRQIIGNELNRRNSQQTEMARKRWVISRF